MIRCTFLGVRPLVFLLLLTAVPLAAQIPPVSPTKHDCHVYALDLTEGQKLLDKLAAGDAGRTEDLKDVAGRIEKILGRFHAEVGEEVATTKSYPLPGTGLTVTATVYYTDETIDYAFSMMQGLAIAKKPVANAIHHTGAAVTEVNLEKSTYKLRTKQRIMIHGKPWLVGLECQCMSTADYQKSLSKEEK